MPDTVGHKPGYCKCWSQAWIKAKGCIRNGIQKIKYADYQESFLCTGPVKVRVNDRQLEEIVLLLGKEKGGGVRKVCLKAMKKKERYKRGC